MDPSQEFAQAVLDQLRRDLKRFDEGRLSELSSKIGRPSVMRYLREVKAENLRMADTLALIRGLGFSPTEYFRMVSKNPERVPMNAAGFLARHSPKKKTPRAFRFLVDWLAWARGLKVIDGIDEVLWDLEVVMESVGFRPPLDPEHILSCGKDFLDWCVQSQTPAIPPRSLPGFINSIVKLADALPSDEENARIVAQLVDLGFFFESRLDDLRIRSVLYLAAAKACDGLDSPKESDWCARQALRLAYLVPDMTLISRGRRWVCTERPSVEESRAVVETLKWDRKLSNASTIELDRALGGRQSYTDLMSGRKPLTVKRWDVLERMLAPPCASSIDRSLDPDERLKPGFFKRLRLNSQKSSQPEILQGWIHAVEIDTQGDQEHHRLERLDKPLTCADDRALLVDSMIHMSRQKGRVSPREGALIGRLFLRLAAYHRRCGELDEAVDAMESAVRLIERLPGNSSLRSYAYRTGVPLLVDLGYLDLAEILAWRSSRLELAKLESTENLAPLICHDGLLLSIYLEGYVSFLQARFEDTLVTWRACKKLSIAGKSPGLPSQVVDVSLAKLHLKLDDPSQAERHLEQVGTALLEEPSAPDFLVVKAECLSMLGDPHSPLALLAQAESMLDRERDPTDLILIELERCKHLIRFNRRADAARQAVGLMASASHIERRNPIGVRAIQEIARIAFADQHALTLTVLIQAQHRVKYPRL